MSKLFYFSIPIYFLIFFTSLCLKDIVVKVRIKDAKLYDLKNISYSVFFTQHRENKFTKIKKDQWLYGLVSKRNKGDQKFYSIEIPELGRLMYLNPDSKNVIILDQVEYNRPSFIWNVQSNFDLEKIIEFSLIKILRQEHFVYKTLIGNVKARMEMVEIIDGKNSDFVRALRFNASRKKVIREILRYKNIL